ncbi:hypothetical protein WH96_05155 [Kiloniella spongiae]|uniref:Peptidase C45 hydrolase domain-containing protein n=1 Tax=Kiloniella spongiae TaxID=1489064 RepID=A0A0H2MH34_9PROT|nr:carcinine hydrolase/isopenicillin-N N-acyltransferase family protein [Kiloniella spongiae]KLN61708.1 hypothetical protein WH96_05155 [Kiloniella spongiae]
MCTIGGIHISQDEYILFKNKDFTRSFYEDQIISNRDIWGAEGLETFAEDPATDDVYSGLSIGANKYGLFAADAHVNITTNQANNYDILVQIALEQGKDIETAIPAVQRYAEQNESWWGNIVLVDASGTVALEVRGKTLKIERATSKVHRTNHQYLHGVHNGLENNDSNSYGRFEWAKNHLEDANNIIDLKKMLASHDKELSNGTPTGICNHTYSQTVCSYLLHYKTGKTTLHHLNGFPCQVSHYNEQQLFN